MLWQIGVLKIDVFPFNMNEFSHSTGADYASHDHISSIRGQEYVGPADDIITLAGMLITTRRMHDGRPQLKTLHGYKESGRAQHVMCGDGRPFGWYVIMTVDEKHSAIRSNGVGEIINVSLTMKKVVSGGRSDSSFNLMQSLVDFFR